MKTKAIVKMIVAVCVIACTAMVAQAKKAIVVAHYGSSDDATRALTIDRITDDVRRAIPEIEVRQAYISPVVRRAMTRKGIEAKSVLAVLDDLATTGYDTVYVQSTTIIDGAEMAEVRRAVDAMKPLIGCLKVGRPLCSNIEDFERVAAVLSCEGVGSGEAVVWVGHGNNLPSTATYCQLDHMIHASGNKSMHVSTIEGYPTATATISELKADPTVSHVRLIPLLLVCGNHTKEDIAGDFADAVKAAGYSTEVVMHGLAENPLIREIYVDRVRELVGR